MARQNLRSLVKYFPKADRDAFFTFLARKKNSAKLIQLFLYLEEGLKFKEINLRMFGDPEIDRTRNLRPTLRKEIIYFQCMNFFEKEPTPFSEVLMDAIMGISLLGNRLVNLGWEFLEDAQKKAKDADQFHLLNSIINLQFEHADNISENTFNDLLSKHEKNKKLSEEDEQASIVSNIISRGLSQRYKEWDRLNIGENYTIDEIITAILSKYSLSFKQKDLSPKLLYKQVKIIQKYIIAKEDYSKFEPYLLEQYQNIQPKLEQNQFLKYKLEFLYMIAHVQFYNKRFNQSLETLSTLFPLVLNAKRYHEDFYSKTVILQSLNHCFKNELKLAINFMEGILSEKDGRLYPREKFNAMFNLSFFYLLKGDQESFHRAKHLVEQNDVKNDNLIKEMGVEWTLKKNLGKLMLLYELGEDNEKMTKEVDFISEFLKNNFRSKSNYNKYKKAELFLQNFKDLISNPDKYLEQDAYLKYVKPIFQDEFKYLPMENIHEISFFIWLRSKAENKEYYELLLQTINRDVSNTSVLE